MQIDDIKKKKIIKNRADYIANHFGFELIDIEEKSYAGDEHEAKEEEKIRLLKVFQKEKMPAKDYPSFMFFYNKPILLPKKGKKRQNVYGLDIINVESAIAEAVAIKTAVCILQEEGYADIVVTLNALGDKESIKDFKKELTNYYKKHANELKAIEKKKLLAGNVLDIFFCQNKEYLKELNQNAPKPINFLSEKSIQHFQQCIEYLENFGIPYVIDEQMVGSKQIFSKIIFKISGKDPKKGKAVDLGFGGRYDEIAQESTKRKKTSAIGLSLSFNKKPEKVGTLKEKKVNIHLLKIGSGAKLKYLDVVEILHKLKVPIKYDIKEEKISKQLKSAIKDEAHYTLIIGELEAKKNKVLVRRMSDFSQSEIDISELGKYLKKLIK